MRTENNTQSRNPQIRTRKKYRIKSKFRFITSMIIMIGLLVGGISLITGMNKSFALTQPQFTEVEVCYGDTLWEKKGESLNSFENISNSLSMIKEIDDICKANDIEASDLEPGMVIQVPEKL